MGRGAEERLQPAKSRIPPNGNDCYRFNSLFCIDRLRDIRVARFEDVVNRTEVVVASEGYRRRRTTRISGA